MKIDPRKLTTLAVNLHGRRIGVINRLAGDKQFFSFDEAYIDDPERPTLSLSFKSRTGGLLTNVQQVHRRVPPFFSNLLPEGHLRTYLPQLSGVNPEREFFLLAALGTDLTGAVTVTPLDEGGEAIAEEPASRPEKGHIGPLRFSLAGVQLKFSAVMESSGGLTIPAEGVGGSWIVKLPSLRFAAVSENEFVMLELAREVGITVPATQLIPLASIAGLPAEAKTVAGNALAVQRFDRGPNGERIHMEDFAQVFGVFPENKYKLASYSNLARVLWAEAGEPSTYEFIRRLAFSVITGNADMHLKNWSLLYPDRRQPLLSPAYDFVSTLPYLPDDQLGLTFGGSRSVSEITPDQLRRFADRAMMPAAPVWNIVRETIAATVNAWRTLAAKDILPADIRAAVHRQIHQVASNTKL